MAQSDGWRVFSYFGVHITPFDIKKRIYIWLPPGFSLISIPNGDGRKLVPAYGAGLSFRWLDFRFPGASNQSTMVLQHFAVLHPRLFRARSGPEADDDGPVVYEQETKVNRLLLGFGHLQDARALEIRISEQAALEEDDLASCIAG